MKEEIKLFLDKAKKFQENARYNFENKNFDLAMFNLEQAVQLLIKAKLLDIKGYYEKTHILRKLLLELAEVWRKEELTKFIEENKRQLRDLERAYITSRYFFEEFFEDEVKRCFNLLEKLWSLLWRE
ncbi:MAG: DNA-binding protein [Candidatus Aenigmatarchaeota archaeon]|nr:MAG: DNA-binding protein [Candidatus Aenigmarchaeota archaeon]